MRHLILFVALAAALPLHAQDGESIRQHRAEFYCGKLADSSSLVAAYARIGSSDAEIQAQMAGAGVMPLADSLRLATERVSRVLGPDEVLHMSYRQCMARQGY